MGIFDNPIFWMLGLATSVVFTSIAAFVPPNAGNLVAAIFVASFASYLGGEDPGDLEEQELEDADI